MPTLRPGNQPPQVLVRGDAPVSELVSWVCRGSPGRVVRHLPCCKTARRPHTVGLGWAADASGGLHLLAARTRRSWRRSSSAWRRTRASWPSCGRCSPSWTRSWPGARPPEPTLRRTPPTARCVGSSQRSPWRCTRTHTHTHTHWCLCRSRTQGTANVWLRFGILSQGLPPSQSAWGTSLMWSTAPDCSAGTPEHRPQARSHRPTERSKEWGSG